jgi:hypothetical protein
MNSFFSPLAEMPLPNRMSPPAEFGGADNVIASYSDLLQFLLVRRNPVAFGFAYSTSPAPGFRFIYLLPFIGGRKMGRANVWWHRGIQRYNSV